VTTLLRRSGRSEDVLRADQPITRGRWTRAGTDNPRRSRRLWRPGRYDRSGTTGDETTSGGHRPACASPLPCCLAASPTPPGAGLAAWWQQKDDVRTMAVTGQRCWSMQAETPLQPEQLDDDL